MAASRLGDYHVRPPTTWPGPQPHLTLRGIHPAPREPRRVSPTGSTRATGDKSSHVISTGRPAREGGFGDR